MTAPFTRAELLEMDKRMMALAPRMPVNADVRRALAVKAVTTAGSDTEMLIFFRLMKGKDIAIKMNLLIARTFIENITTASETGGWWKDPDMKYRHDESLPFPTSADADRAHEVVSLTTGAAGPIMVAILRRAKGKEELVLAIDPSIGAELVWSVMEAGKRAEWWDDKMDWTPADE